MSIFGRGSTAIACLCGQRAELQGRVFGLSRRRLACGATPLVAAAQSPPPQDPAAMRQEIEQLRKELDELKGQYESRLAALEAKLSAQPTEQAAAAAAPPPQPAAPALPDQPGLQPTGQAAQAASNVFNPSTAVIGNFVGAGGQNTVNPLPALAMPESEVSFQAVVDPYARADFFIVVRRRGRRSRGGLHHVSDAAGRRAHEGRQDAVGVRQGQHAAHARAAVGRSAARDRKPRRR